LILTRTQKNVPHREVAGEGPKDDGLPRTLTGAEGSRSAASESTQPTNPLQSFPGVRANIAKSGGSC
jgi:hypothetical protein